MRLGSADLATKILQSIERVMISIDGGYLRRLFGDLFGDGNINFLKMRSNLLNSYNTIPTNPFRVNLIRVYYYDGIADNKGDEYSQHRQYFDSLRRKYMFLTVRLGETVKRPDGTFRQKGLIF